MDCAAVLTAGAGLGYRRVRRWSGATSVSDTVPATNRHVAATPVQGAARRRHASRAFDAARGLWRVGGADKSAGEHAARVILGHRQRVVAVLCGSNDGVSA